jgi:hypothetical protein
MQHPGELAGEALLFASLRNAVERLGPYSSLLLVALPIIIIEPHKIGSLAILSIRAHRHLYCCASDLARSQSDHYREINCGREAEAARASMVRSYLELAHRLARPHARLASVDLGAVDGRASARCGPRGRRAHLHTSI